MIFILLLLFGKIGETVFCGLFTVSIIGCLAVFFSNRIESISLKDLSIKLEKLAKIQDVVVAKNSEPQENGLDAFRLKIEGYGTDQKTDKVIKAIGSSKYTFRTISGIIKDTQLQIIDVENAINWLITNGLAVESTGIGGSVYSLTPKAHDIFASLLNK